MSEVDKEFEAFLSRRARVRAGLADSENLEPPEELDRIVLSQARAAIRLPRSTRFYTPSRWALPMGLAATVVLTFTVMLHFGLLPKPIKEEAAALEAHLTEESASAPAGVATDSDAKAVPMSPTPTIELPMPVRSMRESERAEPTLRRREVLERLKNEQAVASASTDRPVPMAAAPPLATAAPQADAGSSTAEETHQATNDDLATSGEFSSVVVTGARSAELLKRERARKADPAAWLQHIETLRTQGKTQEADLEWQAFRKAWPDYPVAPRQNP